MNRADSLRAKATIDTELAFLLRKKQIRDNACKSIRKFNNPLRALWWALTGR
jgi:hypothetical protein